MDASAYNMSFDKEQLSVLCANYDRRIDTLAKENSKLREFASKLLVGVCDACAFPPCDECEVYATARKLGVEVRKLDVPDD